MCYSPRIAIRDLDQHRLAIETGSKDYSIHFIRPWGGLSAREYRDEIMKLPYSKAHYESLDVACGQCIACRMKQASEWTTRLTCEYLMSDNALFLTLTYDDEHLPKSDLGFPTLNKYDVRQFNYSLTNYCQQVLHIKSPRHYICGEYGSTTFRPHLHSIHFNLPIQFFDGKKLFANQGNVYWSNDVLNKIWGKGFVVIGGFSSASAGYVARYVTKKLNGKLQDDRFDKFGQIAEFSSASNRPGIGREYYEQYRDEIYAFDSIVLPGKGKVPTPSYYDHLLGDIDGFVDELNEYKAKRRLTMDRAISHLCSEKNISYLDYLEGQKVRYDSILKKLPRIRV